ncbi:MAG TPA: hypothetical protein VH763_16435 [Gemmatimonadales bacterium]|jgi:hypothetical protein
MPQVGFTEQIATLNATLQAIESRVASGEVTRDALTEFKSSVDDMRLRLWGLLSAGSANDYRAFQERFRLRRAKEICRGLETDLRNGGMSTRHEELPALAEAAAALVRSIEAIQPPRPA